MRELEPVTPGELLSEEFLKPMGLSQYRLAKEICTKIWRFYAMNGTLSVATTLRVARIIDVQITDDTLSVALEDGRTISVPIGWYPRLACGTPSERAHWQISGAGYGIHWPELDEDLGAEGLLLGKCSAESPASFQRWLQRRKMMQPAYAA